MTSRRQDWVIRPARLHSRYQTAPEMPLLIIDAVRKRLRESGSHARRPYVGLSPDSGTSVALYGMVNSPCT